MKPFTLKQPMSLSSVAQNLGLSGSQPLQNCNETLRGKKPDDVIPTGTRLAIPLKEAEYDRIIKTLEALKHQIRDDMYITLKDLDDAKRAADRWTTGVDFIADIAKILVGDGAAAVKYRGIVRRQHIERMAIQSLQKVTVALGDYDERGPTGKAADTLGSALADNALKQKPVTLMRGAVRSLVVEGAKIAVHKEAHDRLARLQDWLPILCWSKNPQLSLSFGSLGELENRPIVLITRRRSLYSGPRTDRGSA